MTVLECADAQDIKNFLKLSEKIEGPMELGEAKTLIGGLGSIVAEQRYSYTMDLKRRIVTRYNNSTL